MKTKGVNIKNARFDTRLSQEQKDFFEKAAQIGGYRNLTDFVIISAQEKASEIISEHERVLASQRDSAIFYEAVMNPKAPNEALRAAANDFKLLFAK